MKRALNSITETAAVTWARQGIRVNGITPGGTATEMIDAWEAAAPGVIARIKASMPIGRMAEPREVAEVAAWLLSDRASMVTGANVPVDGGSQALRDQVCSNRFDSLIIACHGRPACHWHMPYVVSKRRSVPGQLTVWVESVRL